MATVNVVNIEVENNPATFNSPFLFQITFECLAPLAEDLEWRVVYVGSAESSTYDQELESVLVGPVPVGTNKFALETKAPDMSSIPTEDVLGVTVVLLTCSYRGKEFIRVGYYVNNDRAEPVEEGAPEPPLDPNTIRRSILADKPRVTRFPVDWS